MRSTRTVKEALTIWIAVPSRHGRHNRGEAAKETAEKLRHQSTRLLQDHSDQTRPSPRESRRRHPEKRTLATRD